MSSLERRGFRMDTGKDRVDSMHASAKAVARIGVIHELQNPISALSQETSKTSCT